MMSSESTGVTPAAGTDNIDAKIAYHEEMEYLANSAGDFTRAQHHRTMQAIYAAMKDYKNSKEMKDSALR